MSDKGKRGGKHSNERLTAEEQRTRRAKKEVVENSVSYDFDNPRLGFRTIPGINREDVLKKAHKLGYTEKDIINRERR